MSIQRAVVLAGVGALCLAASACAAKSASPAAAPVRPSSSAPDSTAPETTPGGAPATKPSSSGAASSPLPDHYDPSRNAAADIRAALALAKADHKEVLIDFGADWCPDCRVLGTTFHSAQVRPTLDQGFHVVAVDVGKFDHNLDVAGAFVNLQTSGIPALVVLKADGSIWVATNDGSFADARTMSGAQVLAFLKRWAP
jgi:thiol-disulfide isomerase/thioredoxin